MSAADNAMGKQCKGCAYAVRLSLAWCCDYLSLTGHRRPCPPGEACTVRKEAERDPKKIWRETKPMMRRSWDTGKARALYDAGKLDGEIAAELGTTAIAIGAWRRKQGLPSNWGRLLARPEAPEPPERAAPPPSPAPAPHMTLPTAAGSVELSVELNGCSFALHAPDLAGARSAYAYAGRVLAGLDGNSRED